MKKLKIENRNYSLKEIRELLSPKDYKRFLDWMEGQTMGVEGGKLVVYPQDLELFLKGGDPTD